MENKTYGETYKEAENELKELQTNNEVIFRCGIFHLLDIGTRHLTDELVEETCKEINMHDDSHSMITNEFQCAIVRMVGKLAEYDHVYLLKYISKYVKLDA